MAQKKLNKLIRQHVWGDTNHMHVSSVVYRCSDAAFDDNDEKNSEQHKKKTT